MVVESIQVPRLLTADDIIPLIGSLSDNERQRLLRWILSPERTDAAAYSRLLPVPEEFSADDDSLAWEAEGWEEFQ